VKSTAQRCRRGFALLLACASASASWAADDAIEREAQLTAAYVFNFMKFVEWPAQVQGDLLQVCFAGAQNVRDALAKATGDKRIGSRRIVVRSLVGEESTAPCQVLYVGEQAELAPRAFDAAATLTIGEDPKFTQQGGIIQLYTESNRLRFAINVDHAKHAGLTVSSNLLQLATRVEQGIKQ
jgi:hypothetical protein